LLGSTIGLWNKTIGWSPFNNKTLFSISSSTCNLELRYSFKFPAVVFVSFFSENCLLTAASDFSNAFSVDIPQPNNAIAVIQVMMKTANFLIKSPPHFFFLIYHTIYLFMMTTLIYISFLLQIQNNSMTIINKFPCLSI